MIIPRKYEWLGTLYQTDSLARAVIDNSLSLCCVTDDDKAMILNYNTRHITAFLNIGCGIPGKAYENIIKGFLELDETNPYENGLTFRDVTGIEYEIGKEGEAIQLRFVSRKGNTPYRIVGFAAIENEEGCPQIGTGWKMRNAYEIG